MPSPTTETGTATTARPTWLARVGVASWSIVGVVAVVVIFLFILATISEVALPVVLGALIAVVVKPAADALIRRGVGATLAAGLVLGGLVTALVGVIAAVVRGLIAQSDQISKAVDDALTTATRELGIDSSMLSHARAAVESLGPVISRGELTKLVSGIGAVVGLASGVLLATIVLYYMVKDGAQLRGRLLDQVGSENRAELNDFVGESCRTLRSYAHGRTVLSAIVTAVMGVTAFALGLPLVGSIMAITFVGGYVPYIGAFVAGAFTMLLALGDGGVGPAIVVLIVSLAANLLLENFVEPKVMGKSLDIHPLVVLVVTALGGLVGGIIGLIIAVPLTVIAGSAFERLRTSGHLERAAAKARPAAEKLLGSGGDGDADRSGS